MWYGGFRPYVPVAKRRAQAAREVAKRQKKGQEVSPVVIEGRNIANTFWGKSWCDNLESYSDFANRLPRGRTYVRNGSVVDLKIAPGKINALVSGSEVYKVDIDIDPVPSKQWGEIKAKCAGQIGSLVELLQGKLSKHVIEIVTAHGHGLFPRPGEIKMRCSCPDWAGMCKHLAAVLYGVGARLDHQPELLFTLRKVDQMDLIEEAVSRAGDEPPAGKSSGKKTLEAGDVAGVFGIEFSQPETAPAPKKSKPKVGKSKPAKATPAESKSKPQPAARKSPSKSKPAKKGKK